LETFRIIGKGKYTRRDLILFYKALVSSYVDDSFVVVGQSPKEKKYEGNENTRYTKHTIEPENIRKGKLRKRFKKIKSLIFSRIIEKK